MSDQCRNLTWHTFSEHLQLMFKDLYEETKHTDVTLVCDDQAQYKAHKIVLSACSPVFKKIIDNHPSQHPLIYLRGIQSYEIESILQFMYLGEGMFYYERIREFLQVAKELEVKEIGKCMEIQGGDTFINDQVDHVEMGECVEMLDKEEDTEEALKNHEVDQQQIGHCVEMLEKEEDVEETPTNDEVGEDEVTPPIEKKPRIQILQNQTSSVAKPFLCPECGAVFSTSHSMLIHNRSIHQGFKYPCGQCDYAASRSTHLQRHIESIHEGFKYPCDHCDYEATRMSSLQIHIQSKHEDIKYPCNQCDSEFTLSSSLLKHKRSKHEGVRYPCIQCNYQATQKGNLLIHMRKKHYSK